jgi:SAM-dependent methyltransferase
MYPRKAYHKYCDYHKMPGALKRLDFIVNQVRYLHQDKSPLEVYILDLGCGNGNTSVPLASLGYPVMGIDIDSTSIVKAKHRNPFPNASFRVCSAENLVAEGRQFDVVVCAEVFEHVLEPEKLACQVHALLEPGGVLIATIPNGLNPHELWRLFLRRLRSTAAGPVLVRAKRCLEPSSKRPSIMSSRTGKDYGHKQNFTLKSFSRIIGSCGFSRLRIANHMMLMDVVYYYGLWRLFPSHTRFFQWWERRDGELADKLPTFLVSGWYLVFKKE